VGFFVEHGKNNNVQFQWTEAELIAEKQIRG